MEPENDLAPTFEDLAIDDSLGDLERIQKYAYSNIALQRLVHVKMLADTARAVGCAESVMRVNALVFGTNRMLFAVLQ
jgi:serine/threonine-protein phosphatase 4 regulatory subunit 1